MKNSDRPNPFKRHSWLLVLIASVSASIGFYNHLLDVDIQLIQNEFAYRSNAKVDAIRAIFKQHIDASMSISAFLKGEMAQHESLNASEAASFSRAMLDVHPSELVFIVFIPPVGFGDSQFVGRDGVGRPDPSLDRQGLRTLPPGAPGIQMLQNQERRWLTRLSLSMDGKHGKGYVVSDWDTAAMLGVAITEMTEAGLDVEIGLVDGGQFSRIYQHHSRLPKAEAGEKKMAWRVRLSLNGVELEVRTHASPTVLRQKLSTDPIWALLLGLAFSLILAYLTYNRSRYGERLFRAVERRTQEVEGERLKLASIIDHANEAIMLMDDLGRVLRANPAASSMFGYAAEEWLGLSVHALVPEEIREPHVQWLAEEMAGKRHDMMGKVREVRARRKDGSIFLCEITVNEFATVKGRRISVILRDLTERKQAEESVRKLSQAIEQAGESILITNRQGIIEYVNPAFTKITGYSTEEAIGQTPRLLKSGQQDATFYENMWNTITSGKVWNGKIIDRKKDGSFFPAMLTISPIRDKSGKSSHYCSHYVGIQSDLTEFENMEKQFHQAQKMEALGTLVGGIAHDFNNILAGITGNLYLAKQRVRETPDVAQKLANVEQLSFRAAEMIQQLLTFSRKGSVDIKPLPLTPFIKQTLKLLRTSVP
ncbi:MAG: PAS domain S-box protein, partial [Mariprofundaceae bacterium]